MRILVIGGGGREHAIVWKLSQSPLAGEIFCAPGNAGISRIAKCLPCPANDIKGLVELAKEHKIDFTVVGMEVALVDGIVDEFEANGLRIFGPNKKAAEIEGSKVESKKFMKKHGIPTADFEIFDDYEKALEYIEDKEHPLVIKADGLAAGKGVVIALDREQSRSALREIMYEKKFGSSGEMIVIEEFLSGREVSALACCDGKNIVPMTSAQDYKRALDDDAGSNTGGMGAISPSPFYTDDIAAECMRNIFAPTAAALYHEGRPFVGVLYFGLILTGDGVKVIEYNCRFGDPEAQVVIPRLDCDLLEIMLACTEGKLDAEYIKWKDNASCCVMLVSEGYPDEYEVGKKISGLDSELEGSMVFHSGTDFYGEDVVTSGGRVLGVTGMGDDLGKAIAKAYKAADGIYFDGLRRRSDIGL